MYDLFLNIANIIEKQNNWNVDIQLSTYLRSLIKILTWHNCKLYFLKG